MAGLPITLTCADYARVMPLVTGDVKPNGIALTLIHGSGGSWEMRAEMLRRSLHDPTVQGGEASMAGQLRRIDKSDRSFVGLPVFPLRNFTARDLYVRKGGRVSTPADLIGQRLDLVPAFPAVHRCAAREPSMVDRRHRRAARANPPLRSIARRATATDRPFAVGNADRRRARCDLQPTAAAALQNGPIIRLFSDVRTIERDYFRRTGCFPPQHLIILRRDVWERAKWTARSLTKAFIRCNDEFAAAMRNFPYVSPWLDVELEETEALMGADSSLQRINALVRLRA